MNASRNRISTYIKLTALTLPLCFVNPQILEGQLGIETFFKEIADINFSVACWQTQSKSIEKEGNCPFETREYGVEVTFRLLDRALRKGMEPTEPDSLVPKTVSVKGRDSTTTYDVVKRSSLPGPRLQIDLGIGYSQFDGFRSSDPTLNLRGAVREIPALSLYATYRPGVGIFKPISFYAGFRSGLIQLKDVQIVTTSPTNPDTTVAYNAGDGQVFQAGFLGGLSVDLGRSVSVFAELAQMEREIKSVRWSVGNSTTVPSKFPRELDFSGTSFSFGLQFNVRRSN